MKEEDTFEPREDDPGEERPESAVLDPEEKQDQPSAEDDPQAD